MPAILRWPIAPASIPTGHGDGRRSSDGLPSAARLFTRVFMNTPSVGISGFAAYVPRYRVNLEDWCGWNDQNWSKVSAVVGRSFRVAGPRESVYTMAANAVLRLIQAYDIDPTQVGFLGFGTESSSDNAAGAVVVRGMIDQALETLGKPRLARSVEVPEFKHACLGGVYAMKAAARYLAFDGADKLAIVVAGDIAEYQRGSSGEQTQGAGAVAMLMTANPTLVELDLHRSASSSAYRGPDFRKPFRRHFMSASHDQPASGKLQDFPVFNGRYSTECYTEATVAAFDALLDKLDVSDPAAWLAGLEGAFLHRPYHHMPRAGMAAMVVFAMARNPATRVTLKELATEAGMSAPDFDKALAEMTDRPDLFASVLKGQVCANPFPNAMALVKAFRKSGALHTSLVTEKLELGSEGVMDLGNLYTASLPAWIAAGLEEAAAAGRPLQGREFLAMGYGSGDAAEALMLRVVEGWEMPAAKIGLNAAMENAVELTQARYEALHDGRGGDSEATDGTSTGFEIDRIGDADSGDFQDVGIEYYRFTAAC